MVPPTYAMLAEQAADIMESIIRTHRKLLAEQNAWKIFEYAGSESLNKLDLSLAQAQWAFFEAQRRVRASDRKNGDE